jgi:formylglycine-generating enzyme required for sulfatase activity
VDQIRVLIPKYRDGFGPYANELDWPDAMGFCEWVMTQPGIVAQFPAETDRMTLPSEAQWEYACRAGGDTEFHAGDGVPGFEANRWGFEGLHGELWQWCLDVWDPSAYCRRPDGVADPLVTSTAVADPRGLWHRSARGGSFESPFWQCRSAARTGLIPSVGGWDTGFRVCLVEREPWDVSD